MAQRNSRKGKGKGSNRPDLRTGGGRRAKAERAEERQRLAERETTTGPAIRMRPSGAGGLAAMLLVALLGVGLTLLGAWLLDRWYQVSYPESLWLFLLIGALAVAPAVGRVSRTVRDADLWGALSLLLPAAALAVVAIVYPGCPSGGDCSSIGARGELGLPLSIVLLLLGALAAWGLARWQYRAASERRPATGRVRLGAMLVTMLALFLFPGALIAAALTGLDLLVRDSPALAADAAVEAERECYGLQQAPKLAVRPGPNGYNPTWTTFAVRRANEDRPGTKRHPRPSNWARADEVYPYEATVSYTEDGQLVGVTCRRFGPGTGNVDASDFETTPPENNPLSPKTIGAEFLPRFFTQGEAGPTEEGKRLAKERAAEETKPEDGAGDEAGADADADDDAK